MKSSTTKSMVRWVRSMGRLRALILVSALALATGCDQNPIEAEDPSMAARVTPSVAGRVINDATGKAVAGAHVSIGAHTVTTGVNGRFEHTGLTPGPATIHGVAAGYVDFEESVTVTSGGTQHDISLSRIERFEFDNFALYVPGSAPTIRGVLLTLGGPDTRGFAIGSPFGAPFPAVEAALQALGQSFRALAADEGLAVMGTSLAAMPNGPASDQLLLSALQQAAALSGRPELTDAPLLLYGMSGGGPEASGFTVRNPDRVAALFLKVPQTVETPGTREALGVPTYIVMAEFDAFIDNAALMTTFESSRSAGALWALALEPGMVHHSLSPAQQELTVNWISEILNRRLKNPTRLSPLVAPSGWYGELASGAIGPWATYPGAHRSVSWLPSRQSVEEWQAFIGKGGS